MRIEWNGHDSEMYMYIKLTSDSDLITVETAYTPHRIHLGWVWHWQHIMKKILNKSAQNNLSTSRIAVVPYNQSPEKSRRHPTSQIPFLMGDPESGSSSITMFLGLTRVWPQIHLDQFFNRFEQPTVVPDTHTHTHTHTDNAEGLDISNMSDQSLSSRVLSRVCSRVHETRHFQPSRWPETDVKGIKWKCKCIYLARWANLPKGLYVACVNFFFCKDFLEANSLRICMLDWFYLFFIKWKVGLFVRRWSIWTSFLW